MKTILLLFFLITQIVASAQMPYVPFPEENAVWHVGFVMTPYPGYVHYQYFYDGDTTIGGKDYHKVREKYEEFTSSGNSGDNGIIGYLRQDTGERKVYYFPANGIQEDLLYDFSIGVGEDYPSANNCGGVDAEDIHIDSILINGQYRRIWLNGGGGSLYGLGKMIEGIGYLTGLLGCFEDCFEWCWWLSCFQQDGETIFEQTVFQPPLCNLIGIDDPGIMEDGIVLFPNPIHEGDVTIQFNSPKNAEIRIFDLKGNLFLQQNFHYTSEARLPTAALAQGVYVVRILSEGLPVSRKLVIQ